MQNEKRYLLWPALTLLVSTLFFILALRWSQLDRSPPGWDQGLYLYQATLLHQHLGNGFSSFASALMNIDRGRVPLLIVLVQPFFTLFGPSLDVAVAVVNGSWFVLGWAMLGVSREVFGPRFGYKAGFFGFCFFAIYPLTSFLSQNFLVELPLVAFVLAAVCSLMKLLRVKTLYWSLIAGLFLSFGVLTKVTYSFIVMLPFVWAVVCLLKTEGPAKTARLILPAIALPFILAGPYYLHNYREIAGLSIWLSSSTLSKVYGFGAALSWDTIIGFWKSIFFHPVMIVGIFNVALVAILWVRHQAKERFSEGFSWHAALTLALCFPVSFLLASFGEIKDPRYLYPGLLPIFVLFGAALVFNLGRQYFKIFATLSILLALPGWLYVNALATKEFAQRTIGAMGFNIDAAPGSPPDQRPWDTAELVQSIDRSFEQKKAEKQIFVLGGNRYFHLRLLDFYSVTLGAKLKYNALPYYEKPDMTLNEALKTIEKAAPDAVIYKTGENWPLFTTRLDGEIVKNLEENSGYAMRDLGVVQPDGSHFVLFRRIN